MKVAGRIEIGVCSVVRATGAIRSQQSGLSRLCRTRIGLVAEGSPKGEVDIEWSFDFDGDVARHTNSHVIPERMLVSGRGA